MSDENPNNTKIPVYECSISAQITWQAHSMSNEGSKGSNRTMSRRQLLSDGIETDACSGNILKHYHAQLMREHLKEIRFKLCPDCSRGDSQRTYALEKDGLTMKDYLQCGLCDSHGFLIPEKKVKGTVVRRGASKHSLIEFSMALANPDKYAESTQLYTRQAPNSETGGQMIFKRPSRSGTYALCIRFKAAGLGIDTQTWKPIITDSEVRLKLYLAILKTLCDQLLSPSGALTSTMLPHLTGLEGVIVIKTTAGRACLLSPLNPDFITQTQQIVKDPLLVFPFATFVEFNYIIEDLLKRSVPYPPFKQEPHQE